MNNKGFTLIEVLIGLFIAVIAAISVSQVIASTNKVVDAGRKTFIATNLAREGLELTREMRDNVWFSQADRSKWVSQSNLCPTTATYTYTIDPVIATSGLVKNSTQVTLQPKLYLQANGEWAHTVSATDTGYTRTMTIDCSQSAATPAFVTLTSTVGWTGAYGAKSVFIKELLYNWLP